MQILHSFAVQKSISDSESNEATYKVYLLLARDAFVRTIRHTIAMMFVRPSVCPSVWDGRALWSYGAL